MRTLWQDLRFGARLLRLNPGFAAIAMLSLGLGIGANTAIFQLLDAVRLRTLPVKNPQELAVVRFEERKWGSGNFRGDYFESELSNALWQQIRDHQEAFSGIFAWASDQVNLAPSGETRNARANWVSGDYFRVLGERPILGRVFTAEDDKRGCGSTPGAVISYGFWQREFGGDASIVGQKITIEGHPFQIIGVTAPGFFGVEVGRSYDLAILVCSEPLIRGEFSVYDTPHGYWLSAMGRLKPGWTFERATAHLKSISPEVLEATVPPRYPPDAVKKYLAYRFIASPADNGFSSVREDYQHPLWMLLGIAGLVLLIACANLANLMLARATAREREIGVRLSLGASRGRLIRQMLLESLLLAAVGALLGIALSQALTRLMIAFLSTPNQRMFVELYPDWRVLAFTSGIAALTCLIFGLAPALRATRIAPVTVLKSTGRGMTAGRERFGLRRALVVSQVALSLVLLVGALLFVRTLRNLLTLDPGFQQQGVLVANLDLTRLNLPAERRVEVKHQLLERVRAVPGIASAADTNIVPIGGNGWNENIVTEGTERLKGTPAFSRITPGYFKTMKTPLLAGREFDDHDDKHAPKVAIVNETFVKKIMNGRNPIGVRFHMDGFVGKPTPTYEIVGLVKDTKYQDLREEPLPIAFVAAAQEDNPDQYACFMIRSSGSLGATLPMVKEALMQQAPELSIEFHVLSAQIRDSLLRERLMATLSGFFGFLAALLATVGLYGVISYTVARRTNEIGIRMALGAQRGNVLGMIMREAGALLAIGLIAGAGLALAAGRAATSFLYGLKPYDPLTIVLATLALAAVAAAASFLPAQRASRLDPMVALREE
jgi:putative ABC transport system permease protein